jgi:DNA-binding MarR family transcriptional regulator
VGLAGKLCDDRKGTSLLSQSYQVPECFRKDLSFLLRVAAEKASAVIDEELAGLGLQSRAAAVLLLAGQEAANQSVLAEKVKTHPNAVTALLNGLEDRQLVRREQNPRNRREYLVKVTPGGGKLLREVGKADEKAGKRIAERLSGAEQEELTRLLLKLIEAW